LATTSARERPIAALPPFAEPFALVVTFAVCVACAESLPVSVNVPEPVPTDALVVMFEIEIATCAERTKLPPPAAPPSAVVVIRSVLVAVIVRSSTPVNEVPSAIPAVVVSFTTLTATDAPIPVVFPSADCFASASA
jgi:hypothetical protein